MKFYVRDSGIGIPPELHDKIFEPFRQVELEITYHYGGTGLGLSISRKLVELLKGKIWLESKPGQGSIFYFTIPLHEPNELKNQKAKAFRKERSSGTGQGCPDCRR